jgi:hypothetical protein
MPKIGAYFRLEEEARAAKTGLWSNPHAMPPWEYRHGSKSASRSAPSPDEVPGKQAKASGGYQCGAKNKCGEMASCHKPTRIYHDCSAGISVFLRLNPGRNKCQGDHYNCLDISILL